MINLVIYPGKPILVGKKHLLELITDPTAELIGLKYKDKHYYLSIGRSVHIEPDVKVNFYNVYRKRGISLGFSAPTNITLQRSIGKDETGRHLWYTRKKRVRGDTTHQPPNQGNND